ncbi:MAG: rhomboid family intramembrane serine protease [Opitutaceae bacterium]|jgi:membrane associated rhomboid family serine protease
MLQDRPYMRDNYETRHTSVITWLISLVVAVYVIQMVLTRLTGFGLGLEPALGLSAFGLRSAHLWTLLTYGFLHDTGNLLQVIGYLLVIYFVGREVLPILGTRRFIGFYAAALVSGGIFWSAVHWRSPEILLGASAAVSALVILYACFFPNREITLLLFFILPVNIRPKIVAYVMIALDLCGFVFYEILGAVSPFGGAAHSAHLGGMAAGWVYFRYLHDANWNFERRDAEIELPRWLKQRGSAKAPPPAYSINMGDKGHLRAEVDRILDKINSDGFGSLSAAEKKVLDEARDLIGRR